MGRMKNIYEDMRQVLERTCAVHTALALMEWDNETLAPSEAAGQTAKTAGILSGLYYETITGSRLEGILDEWEKNSKDSLDGDEKEMGEAMAREARKERRRLACVPREEYEAFVEMTNSAGRVWAKAKEQNDFSVFSPVLAKIIECKKKIASYRSEDGENLYDAMLDEFDDSFHQKELDEFFGRIKEELVPFLNQVKTKGKKIDDSFLGGNYPREKQEQLARMIGEYIGFDFKKGVLSVSAHPFTTSLHNKDVRITTHYDRRLDHSLFSVIHEGGHALYELGIDDRLTQTILGQGASMAMHESQSRFMENMIGRSQAFWEPIYGRVQELFPEQLGMVSLKRFIEAINRVEPGLIRTSADELTYSLHILVRYELEKGLMKGEIKVEDLEAAWADKYEKYLGVRPKSPAEGALQDIHWSQGSFGYFPSYALGSAFAAQIYEKMTATMDVDMLLKEGRIKEITGYLREHIHRFGKMKDSLSLVREASGEDFDPGYYIHYLQEKYGRLYL